MITVLFVCLGNICRSPMAEAIFRHMLTEEKLNDKILVDSAGTSGWHDGNPPHQGTRAKLDEYDISYENMKARQVMANDLTDFDYMIAMDEKNIAALRKNFDVSSDKSVLFKLMNFVQDPMEADVPDPYYTGDFDYTYALISQACGELLTFLKEKHHIKG